MQKVLVLTLTGLLFFSVSIPAQHVNEDSLALVSKINADQLRLEKLQNQLEQQIKNKQNAAMRAQQSANENLKAANKLSSNPGNKKLARKAKKKAGDARRDARNARKAADRLDELQKDIENLKERIAENQVKLNRSQH